MHVHELFNKNIFYNSIDTAQFMVGFLFWKKMKERNKESERNKTFVMPQSA